MTKRRPSGNPRSDKFGVPYGGLTNGIQQALGLPTMADVGCNPICDATDPDEQRIHDLAVGITADSQHSFGCIAQAYGIAGGGGAAFYGGGGGGAAIPKRFGGNTSWFSKLLGNKLGTIEEWSNGTLKGIPVPLGGPGTGEPFRWGATKYFGRALGRVLPYAGAATTAISSWHLWNCL
jgi:hypothetical protein